MIQSVYGKVTGYGLNSLYLRSGNIEWDLTVSNFLIEKIGSSSDEVRVFTYLHHKEDTMQLFGFYSAEEREAFLQLISVSGVGPKLGIKILSGMPLHDLMETLDAGDVTKLSSVKGLGAKGAQKIILALREKLRLKEDTPTQATSAGGQFTVPLEALIQMGFNRKSALTTLKDLAAEHSPVGMSESAYEDLLFREALLRLS